ncbi:MAG: acyltransferase, partial [Arcobacteraceae bacterium]
MHGTLRLILATLVVLSHLGITLYGYNIGVSAVVVFYLLAGMVSYKLISKNYKNKALSYYLDRIKRIFPLYLLVLVFSYIIYKLGATSYFISSQPDLMAYLSNLTIIPLSYFMYNDLDKFTLLPPVWSLGVELQFYILAPFILLCTKRIVLLFLFSFVVYILATVG